MLRSLVSLLLVATVHVVTGDLLLTSTPSVIFNGVNSELDVRCSLSPNSTEVSRVMAIQIEKLNGIHLRPLASIATGENAKLDTQFARKFEATVHGMMSVDTPTDSFLQMTLRNVDAEGAGMYVCAMSILDQSFLLEREETRINVSLAGPFVSPDTNGSLSLVLAQLRNLQEQVTSLTQQLSASGTAPTTDSNSAQAIAFTARPALRRPFKLGKLIFETVDVNTGGAYDPVQSLFRVPVNGTYVIMASVSCQQAKTITDLMVNHVSKAQLTTAGEDQTSVSLVLELLSGDTVWLEGIYNSHNHTDVIVFADKDTVFSGFLLDRF